MKVDRHWIWNRVDPPYKVYDLIEWAQQFGKYSRRVDQTSFFPDNIDMEVRVSTVFLGIDHQYGEGKPILWETMIFGGEHDEYQQRYHSEKDARIGHLAAFN